MASSRLRRAGRVPARLVLVFVVVSTLGPTAAAADPMVLVPHTPGWAPPAVTAEAVRYELPAAGAVRRPFEPPEARYGPGHRGADLDVPVGSEVRAAAAGTVTHAGPIAGTTWVSLVHGDGVVTSYGPVGALEVRRGDHVRRGARLGVLAAGGHGDDAADTGLHWGARRDGRYIDPLSLLADAVPRPSLIGTGGWTGSDHAVQPYEPWGGGTLRGWSFAASPQATAPGFAVPPNPNHLVMVPGLGSSSDSTILDPAHLGYDPGSVTFLSYAGRHDGPADPADPRRDQRPFDASHTADSIDEAAKRLHEQLLAQAAREPGRAVDLLGHSMGGVVVLHYLTTYHDAYDRDLPPIGHVVMIAAPLRGSDTAAFVDAVHRHSVAGPIVGSLYDLYRDRRDPPMVPLQAPALRELATDSAFLRRLATGFEAALHDGPGGSLAMGTRILTIGGGGDLVVGPGSAKVPRDPRHAAERLADTDGRPRVAQVVAPDWQPWNDGPTLEHRVLPGGHRAVLETDAIREVIWRFLADEEVVASPGRFAEFAADEHGFTLRLLGELVRLHDTAWQPLRRAARPPPTVPGRR